MSWNTLDQRTQDLIQELLTDRQRTVLGMWLQGDSTRRIALRLGIAESTARGHLTRALQILKPHIRKDAA